MAHPTMAQVFLNLLALTLTLKISPKYFDNTGNLAHAFLVTANTSEFSRVPELNIENWLCKIKEY